MRKKFNIGTVKLEMQDNGFPKRLVLKHDLNIREVKHLIRKFLGIGANGVDEYDDYNNSLTSDMNSLFKEFWEKAVSKSQVVDRSFIDDINTCGTTFSDTVDKLCLIEMTNPETGEKKFAHTNELNRCVYYDRGLYNYEELKNICSDMFFRNFGIKVKDDCYYGDSGKEIEKFFTDNFVLLEKFLDSVLIHKGGLWEYSLKDGCEFDVPDALLRKKSQWIGHLMNHCYVFDVESDEFTDEIDEKSYDENGHFEYYVDDCDCRIPVFIENWIDAFFLVMVSYFSIRKVKYSDVF